MYIKQKETQEEQANREREREFNKQQENTKRKKIHQRNSNEITYE